MIAAEHPQLDALRIVAEGGSDVRLSYAELAARSNQVANWLRDLGVRRGDRVLLMLGNLPKTISGKIRRVELRDTEHRRHPAAPSASDGARGVTEFWEEDFPDLKA